MTFKIQKTLKAFPKKDYHIFFFSLVKPLRFAVKEIGSYKATLKLHKEVTIEVAFEVVAE